MSKLAVTVCFILGLIVGGMGVWMWVIWQNEGKLVSPITNEPIVQKELPYKKYTFENLAAREYPQGKIEIGRTLTEEESYSSSLFYYSGDGKRISGQINFPMTPNSHKMPVVVMARGYVDKEIYTTGIGTKNSAAIYAKNGYITIAPDFAGFGESDPEDTSAIGARLSKPVQLLELVASLPSLPQVDLSRVYLWGHSNGGQITLSVLEIVGKKGGLPGVTIAGATLWAPVSKPFPYSVLYYSDEPDDKGKWLRAEIAAFEKDYDVYDYSIDRYWDWITTPILLHQGTADPEVPTEWSTDLAKTLREKEKDISYTTYPGADHNLKGAWDTVVVRDLDFFTSRDTIEQ